MKKLFFTFISFVFLLECYSQTVTYSRIKISIEENTLQELGAMGIPIEGYVHKGLYLITELPDSMLQKLSLNQIQYDILVSDVSSFYVQQNETKLLQNEKSNCDPNFDYQVPSNFSLGTMGGYLTLNELYAQLDSMRLLFPNLVSQRQVIGTFTTQNGRNLYYVKLSDNPDISESEPKVYYQALVHAREPMGMQQLFFFMWYLLENYSSNSEIQYLLNNAELFFIPCANPDGYEYNRQTNPSGGGMWRKNRKTNNGGSFGVDLNRNFGYMWGYDNNGSSPDPTTDTYRGTSAFSEPETQAVKWFCETLQPRLLLDYHCYSDVLLYPWGYMNQKCPDSLVYFVYSSFLTSENNFAYGTAYETIGYNANGGSFDWYYGEQGTKEKIIGWGPEAGDPTDGFWPAQSRIIDIAKNYVAMNMYAARFALRFAHVHDRTDSYLFGTNQQFVFEIQNLGMDITGQHTVSIIPVANIASVGTQKLFSGMVLLESRTDSISFQIASGLIQGDELVFVCAINNGFFTRYDTIRKVYGQPAILFEDQCSSIANWTGSWGVTTSQFVSPSSSITDSPFGNYPNNTTTSLTMSSQINLSDAVAARLKFYAKWNIEKGYDYVQLLISDNNGVSWTPLCGKYTVKGTASQSPGEPVYDGAKYNWVEEEIILDHWLGSQVKFRFELVSDWWTNADGFYFDDFIVEAIIDNPTQSELEQMLMAKVYPNPASDYVKIEAKGQKIVAASLLSIHGDELLYSDFQSTDGVIDVRMLPAGMYILKIQTSHQVYFQKMMITH